MFFTEALAILWKPFLIHLLAFITFATLGWWGITRAYTQIKFQWFAPVLVGGIISLSFSTHTLVVAYENRLINESQRVASGAPTAPNAPGAAAEGNQGQSAAAGGQSAAESAHQQVLKLKQNLLKMVEAIVQNPALLTKELKDRVAADYSPLFPNLTARKETGLAIQKFYECQGTLFQDMLKSYQKKQVVKSDARQACEKADGHFFERETLWTPDVLKQNNAALESIASKQRLPTADGSEKAVSKEDLEKNIEASKRAKEIVKNIFD